MFVPASDRRYDFRNSEMRSAKASREIVISMSIPFALPASDADIRIEPPVTVMSFTCV